MKRVVISVSLCMAMVLVGCITAVRRIIPAVNTEYLQGLPILILDAGHGGEDGGALSAAGNKESEINLDIVLKLESLMAFLGVDTVLTRRTDISIHDADCTTLREKKVSDLKNRVNLINNTPNAMLISVHQNTFTDPKYKGTQVFFRQGEISAQWGEVTQELFRSVLDQTNGRSAATIPEYVYLFNHISCPALLVECGFLSNGEDAALLLTDAYQRKIALVLSGAYFHQLERIPTPLGSG